MVRQEGLEPPTHSLEGCCSIHLSYWRCVTWREDHVIDPGPPSRGEVGAPGFEPGTSCSQSRRDTRLRYAPRTAGQFTRQGPEGQPRLTIARMRALNARPRWLSCSFSETLSSANVRPAPAKTKYGS